MNIYDSTTFMKSHSGHKHETYDCLSCHIPCLLTPPRFEKKTFSIKWVDFCREFLMQISLWDIMSGLGGVRDGSFLTAAHKSGQKFKLLSVKVLRLVS